MINQRLISN